MPHASESYILGQSDQSGENLGKQILDNCLSSVKLLPLFFFVGVCVSKVPFTPTGIVQNHQTTSFKNPEHPLNPT